MRITELHLSTQDLHAQRLFYTRTLGLPLVTETVASFTIQAGATRLLFQRTEQEGVLYHFAFSIPSTKLAHAKEWLLARTPSVVPLLSLDGQDEFHDESWNVSQFYFYDAAGNILEFIAHHDVPDSTPDGFDEHSVLHVSEIGLAVDNVLAQVAEFKDRLGLESFIPIRNLSSKKKADKFTRNHEDLASSIGRQVSERTGNDDGTAHPDLKPVRPRWGDALPRSREERFSFSLPAKRDVRSLIAA